MMKILDRLQQYMNQDLPDAKAGFRKGRGARDQINNIYWIIEKARSVQFSISVMSDPATPWTSACQASLSITNSWSLLKLLSTESVMTSTISSSSRRRQVKNIYYCFIDYTKSFTVWITKICEKF